MAGHTHKGVTRQIVCGACGIAQAPGEVLIDSEFVMNRPTTIELGAARDGATERVRRVVDELSLDDRVSERVIADAVSQVAAGVESMRVVARSFPDPGELPPAHRLIGK